MTNGYISKTGLQRRFPTGGVHVANAARYAIMAQNEINRAVALAASITGFGATGGLGFYGA